MSPTKRPSSVAAMRRAVAASPAVEAEPARVPTPAPSQPPRPEKPVRFTLDLDRPRHLFLKQYAVQAEADASQVMRALLDQLRDDAELAGRIRDRIWQDRAS